MLKEKARKHLTEAVIPFWNGLKDDEYGGFYGRLSLELELDKKAVKGVILNSRILWFYSNAYFALKDESMLSYAKHAYEFLRDYCIDKENGGVFWSMNYDGTVEDSTKHTYNQAFAIYALSSYHAASGNDEALKLAWQLYDVIETKCRDEIGYLESFNRFFEPEDNDKLSENGVIAHKTMNSLLHIYEAYSELYRVTKDNRPKERLEWILDTFADKVYNPVLRRQEVFFDKEMNSIIDLHSYGHDIEASWLIDRGCDIIGEQSYKDKIFPITQVLADNILKTAYHKSSLWNECEKGVPDKTRVWWVQAEGVLGFLNAYKKEPERKEFLEAAEAVYEYIMDKIVDKRPGSEWLSEVDDDGNDTVKHKDIVEPWKCPYHNGRMCFELMKGTV